MPKKTENKKPTIVLIDAHAIIHRAYHALPDLTDKEGEPAGALYGLSTMLLKLIKELKPEYIVAAYDLAGPTHRHEVYENYKGTRAKIEDSLISQLDRSRSIFEAFHIPVYEAEGFEADDVIGTLATTLKKDFDVLIASGDMDTLQLVSKKNVQVFTLRKGINDTVMYDEDAVVARFGFNPQHIADYKGLAGDPSDNIIGIQGIGAKTATTLIQTYGGVEDIYKNALKNFDTFKEKTGLTERIFNLIKDNQEEAEFSKVLATIRTDAPVTFNKKEAHWVSNFSSDSAVKLFTELGFRSLVPRMQDLDGANPKEEISVNTNEDRAPSQEDGTREAQEAKVLLFLLNSELTNPSLEDVLNETGASSIREARAMLEEKAKQEKVFEVFENIEQPLIPVLERVNETGVTIDREYLKGLSKEYHTELKKVAKKIYAVAGVE